METPEKQRNALEKLDRLEAECEFLREQERRLEVELTSIRGLARDKERELIAAARES